MGLSAGIQDKKMPQSGRLLFPILLLLLSASSGSLSREITDCEPPLCMRGMEPMSTFVPKDPRDPWLHSLPGMVLPQKRVPGMEFVGKRVPGMEFVGKRGLGMEFLGKRSPGLEIVEKRVPGMEFVGKRVPGMEFVGKRSGMEYIWNRPSSVGYNEDTRIAD